MKKITTITCCVSLMFLGIGMAMHSYTSHIGNATAVAATTYNLPSMANVQDVRNFLPLDIRLDWEKTHKSAENLETTNQDSSEVTKVDNYVVKKVPVVVERKVEVPVLYIATPKRDTLPDHSGPIYEVHRVDCDVDIPVPSSLGVEPYEE